MADTIKIKVPETILTIPKSERSFAASTVTVDLFGYEIACEVVQPRYYVDEQDTISGLAVTVMDRQGGWVSSYHAAHHPYPRGAAAAECDRLNTGER